MKRIIGVALIVIIALSLVACGGFTPREVISAEEFTTIMTGEGHFVEELFYDDIISGLQTLLLADLGDFDVEFFVLETDARAREVYNQIKRNLEDGRGRTSSHRETNLANFSRFIQTTDGRFEALSRVENTLVFISASAADRSAAEAVLELLGY